MHQIKQVFAELYTSIKRHELWLTLGWRDILSRYSRSLLGPFWITLSMGIIAGIMGSLYSTIMQHPAPSYIPYLTTGFIAWSLISSLITEGAQAFTSNATAIKEVPIPHTTYIFRVLWRNLIVLGYNLLAYVVVLVIFRLNPFPAACLVIPALALVSLNGLWMGMLFGLINVRARDFSQLLNNLMRLIFFITPIIWFSESARGTRSLLVHFNPIYYFIEILRWPLLGVVPDPSKWLIASAITIAGWLITLPIYARSRRSIAYFI
jgi:ABC-type polysaccharide/polyol phosphate export permease